MEVLFLLQLSPEEVKVLELPQFSLKTCKVGRGLAETMPLPQEVSVDHRKVIHLRKDQVLSQQGRRQMVTVL